ncbi:hypothetical protein BS47DRAFT_1344678 [Hydnum rufescens UP504]|uniref:Uncharacterized protein n=1 Tax=Hydnum rufescens UP504 TaxID=1448309 RepID=A0A9P6AW93_9AGAM|nr:hypothetical protein BS47DRAFT_1344678 [Hydnum rufescens UP504]
MPATSKREISLPKVSDTVVSKMSAVRSASFTNNTNPQVLRAVNYVHTRPQKNPIEPTIIISGTSPSPSSALEPDLVRGPLTAQKKAPLVIDLTDDKAAEAASSNTRNPLLPIVNRAPKERSRLSVTFANESTVHSPPNSAPIEIPSPGLGTKYQSSILMAHVHPKKPPYVPTVKKESREKSKGTSGGSLEFYEEITSILTQISKRIVDSKMNEFKSIRHNVLLSRNSILGGIQADLEECRIVWYDNIRTPRSQTTPYFITTASWSLIRSTRLLEAD